MICYDPSLLSFRRDLMSSSSQVSLESNSSGREEIMNFACGAKDLQVWMGPMDKLLYKVGPKTSYKLGLSKELWLTMNCAIYLPGGMYLGLSPFAVVVTNRILTLLVGDPYKPSFATYWEGRQPKWWTYFTLCDSMSRDRYPKWLFLERNSPCRKPILFSICILIKISSMYSKVRKRKHKTWKSRCKGVWWNVPAQLGIGNPPIECWDATIWQG